MFTIISCLKGKRTQDIIPKKSDIENSRRLHRVYSDICGPFDVKGYARCKYFVIFVDGFLHYIRIKPIRTKDKASKMLMEWITQSGVETGERVNFLRTNRGGEYIANDFQKWLKTRSIYHEITNTNTPQENGVVERLNRTVLEMVQTMIFDSKLPKSYWTFVVNYAQEILNRLLTKVVSENKTPHKLFLQKKPLVAHIQIFGCRAYVHVLDEKRSKLDPKAVEGFFMGLSENKKGYVITDSRNYL